MKSEQPKEVSWEKILSDYVNHQRAYQEHMNKVEDLNPVVWSWSDASKLPIINPTVDNTAITEQEREKKRAADEHKILLGIENVAKTMIRNGNMVTADLLQRFAPPGVSAQALAMALGISENGRSPGEISGEFLMAKRAYQQHRTMEKSWFDGLEYLRKDEPMEAHADKFGMKGGMKMRWDAAHNYKGHNNVHEDDLSDADRFAIQTATDLSGGKSQKNRDGTYRVFVWLRPGQEEFYQRELQKYKDKHTDEDSGLTEQAAKHIKKVETERAMIVAGDIKPYKHVERYKKDKVQPGTIAAKNIKMGTTDSHGPKIDEGEELDPDEAYEQFVDSESKQLIPQQGQHGPTAYSMHPGELERMKVGRAGVGRRQRQEGEAAIQRTEPEKVEGVSFPTLWRATANSEDYGVKRRDPEHRDVIEAGPGGVMRPARPKSNPTIRRRKTVNLPDVAPPGGTPHGRHFTEGAWRQLVDDAIAGRVKIVRNGEVQEVDLRPQEKLNLIEAAARLAKKGGAIEDTSEFSGLNARAKKKWVTAVVKELHMNRYSDRYGTASQRASRADRIRRRDEAEAQAAQAEQPEEEMELSFRRKRIRKTPIGEIIPGVTNVPRFGGFSTTTKHSEGGVAGNINTVVDHGRSPLMRNRGKVRGGNPDVFRSMTIGNMNGTQDTKERIPEGPVIVNTPTQQVPTESRNYSKKPSPDKSMNDPALQKLLEAMASASDGNVKKSEFKLEANMSPDKPVNKLPNTNKNTPMKTAPNPSINKRIAAELRNAIRASV